MKPSTLARTDRLLIREMTMRDGADYYMIFSDPAASQYDEFEPMTLEELPVTMTKIIDRYGIGEEQEAGVELLLERKMIGVLYWKVADPPEVQIGFHFNQAYLGKGYAFEAAEALILWLLGKYPNLPIVALVDPENTHSIRLLDRLGFTRAETAPSLKTYKGAQHREQRFLFAENRMNPSHES